eukprot:SAG11_NODE_2852_length_2906_cov_50.008553_1_plen_734_part_00
MDIPEPQLPVNSKVLRLLRQHGAPKPADIPNASGAIDLTKPATPEKTSHSGPEPEDSPTLSDSDGVSEEIIDDDETQEQSQTQAMSSPISDRSAAAATVEHCALARAAHAREHPTDLIESQPPPNDTDMRIHNPASKRKALADPDEAGHANQRAKTTATGTTAAASKRKAPASKRKAPADPDESGRANQHAKTVAPTASAPAPAAVSGSTAATAETGAAALAPASAPAAAAATAATANDAPASAPSNEETPLPPRTVSSKLAWSFVGRKYIPDDEPDSQAPSEMSQSADDSQPSASLISLFDGAMNDEGEIDVDSMSIEDLKKLCKSSIITLKRCEKTMDSLTKRLDRERAAPSPAETTRNVLAKSMVKLNAGMQAVLNQRINTAKEAQTKARRFELRIERLEADTTAWDQATANSQLRDPRLLPDAKLKAPTLKGADGAELAVETASMKEATREAQSKILHAALKLTRTNAQQQHDIIVQKRAKIKTQLKLILQNTQEPGVTNEILRIALAKFDHRMRHKDFDETTTANAKKLLQNDKTLQIKQGREKLRRDELRQKLDKKSLLEEIKNYLSAIDEAHRQGYDRHVVDSLQQRLDELEKNFTQQRRSRSRSRNRKNGGEGAPATSSKRQRSGSQPQQQRPSKKQKKTAVRITVGRGKGNSRNTSAGRGRGNNRRLKGKGKNSRTSKGKTSSKGKGKGQTKGKGKGKQQQRNKGKQQRNKGGGRKNRQQQHWW